MKLEKAPRRVRSGEKMPVNMIRSRKKESLCLQKIAEKGERMGDSKKADKKVHLGQEGSQKTKKSRGVWGCQVV